MGFSGFACSLIKVNQTNLIITISKRPNQLRVTILATTVYLSQLANPTPSLH